MSSLKAEIRAQNLEQVLESVLEFFDDNTVEAIGLISGETFVATVTPGLAEALDQAREVLYRDGEFDVED